MSLFVPTEGTGQIVFYFLLRIALILIRELHPDASRAFALRAKGFAQEHEYVDMKAMAQGSDTIFLLSDGAPSWDDFGIKDKDYGEGRTVVDQE